MNKKQKEITNLKENAFALQQFHFSIPTSLAT